MSSQSNIPIPDAADIIRFPEQYPGMSPMSKLSIVRRIYNSNRTVEENTYVSRAAWLSLAGFICTAAVSVFFSTRDTSP